MSTEPTPITTDLLLSQINVNDKYARWLADKKRRENFNEIVSRVEDHHIRNHITFANEIVKAFEYVRDYKIMPSMRSMQFAGLPLDINPTRIYNCSYMPIDHYKSFSEFMFLLLSGCGVGYSVEHANINKLPTINVPETRNRWLIQDSIEGWSDAVNALMKAAFGLTDSMPEFDYRDIREKGKPLTKTGGVAPGPDSLKKALDTVTDIILQKQPGERLTSLEIHDICCYIAECVVSGGIRRSACICYFDLDDELMLNCKNGHWYEDNIQRAMCNNSVIINRNTITKEKFFKMWNRLVETKSGEPGIMFVNDDTMRGNPCNEIGLYPYSFCNLTEMNVGNIKSEQDLHDRCRMAAFIGTMQATYTKFHYLRRIWRTNTEKYAQMAVSMTGICDGEIQKYDLKKAAEIVVQTNKEWAKKFGINESISCTTIKPSGNSSVVLQTASGIHARYAEYYIRRIRINKTNPICKFLTDRLPELVEQDLRHNHELIFKIVIKSPKNSIIRNESVNSMLERILKFSKEWIQPGNVTSPNGNNISATVFLKDQDWVPTGEWIWKNNKDFNGLSFLAFDGGTYSQLPFEECKKEEYDKCVKYIQEQTKNNPLNLDEVVEYTDNTSLLAEPACANGQCEIK